MAGASPTLRGAHAGDWREAAADWARTDGQTWIYLFKAVLAGCLALGIAMRLELPQPRTALTTVFIVMQPQSGMVLAKSFYRFCGTIVGLVVMLALIGLFAQQPELFMLTTSLWIGICTAGAARNRNFRSYGFVLAGYTAALIGIPASQHPDGAFMSAMTRASEVSLGIVCAGVVSALILPRHTGEQMRAGVRARFSQFVDYVSAVLGGRADPAGMEETNARFVADVIGFEAARSAAVFEGPYTRRRAGRLARLNAEFMSASTRFHALHQLMNRLRVARADQAIGALEPYFHEISPLLVKDGAPVMNAADAEHVAGQLAAWHAALPRRVRATRAGLEASLAAHDAHDAPRTASGAEAKSTAETAAEAQRTSPLLDFDTGTELLYRFIEDMQAYAATYASLAADRHTREHWVEHFEPKTNPVTAAVGGIRAGVLTLLVGLFWIATAWPSGGMMMLDTASICALSASFPYPTRSAFQMTGGAALSALLGMVVMFGIYPHIDGFPLLCVALAPFLALAAFMISRPKLMSAGFGYAVFFCFLAGPDNVVAYDPMGFMNDALALVMALLATTAAFAIFLPPSTPWLRNRLLVDLRRQVVASCRMPFVGLRTRFESGTRDLAFQIQAVSAHAPGLRREALQWLFVVLEVGNAMIELRREVAALPPEPRYAVNTPARVAMRALRDRLIALFEAPDAARRVAALHDAAVAIAELQQLLASFRPEREERHRLQRLLSYLHFIRTALLDPQSPLATLGVASAAPPAGVPHAS